MNYFLMLILTGGLSMAASGTAKLIRNRRLLQAAVETEGTIMGHKITTERRHVKYEPIVVFFTPEARRIEFTGEVVSRKRRRRVGESVRVLYHPANPQWCRINNANDLWWAGVELLLGGLLIAAIAAFFGGLFG